jgi:hypothetical protein
LSIAVALCGLLLLLGAANAVAATRFAAPGAIGTAPCEDERNPCPLFTAAAASTAGDDVVLAPGEYTDTAGDLGPSNTIVMKSDVSLHGEAGKPRPVIALAHEGPALVVVSEDTVSHLEIDSSVARPLISVGAGVVEDLIARGGRENSVVCSQSGGIIRDSACLSSGLGATALGISSSGNASLLAQVRNVTAVSTGGQSFGMRYEAAAFGGNASIDVDAGSVIARGAGTGKDVVAEGKAGADVNVTLQHSDFETFETSSSGGGTASVTEPGTGTNITATPLLAADGIHELPGSPTVDKGAIDGLSGLTDIDGQPRALGASADIGADELPETTSTAVVCAPAALATGKASTCTATVADTTGPTAPSGQVDLASDGQGAFGSTAGCALTPAGPNTASCQLTYTPTQAGSGTHKITASYRGDLNHEESRGSTQIQVSAQAKAPKTTLKRKPRPRTAGRLAIFSFASDQAGSSFQCKLDRKPFRSCRSPFKARVKPGRHTFRVRAVGPTGIADPTPALFRWKVSRTT